jgi:hypothetical protein
MDKIKLKLSKKKKGIILNYTKIIDNIHCKMDEIYFT